MAAAYGNDFRAKVVEAVEQKRGTDKTLAIALGISDRSVRRWCKRKVDTGTSDAKKGSQKGHSHSIKDLEMFKTFVRSNSGLTQREMAEKLGYSQPTICRALKKIDFTVKKNNMVIKNGMKSKERHLML
jgi:transposase